MDGSQDLYGNDLFGNASNISDQVDPFPRIVVTIGPDRTFCRYEPTYVGLDWFILNLFFLALVFVPLERVFGRREQRIFREGWRTDLSHFFVSHLGIQVTVLLTMIPAALFFRWAVGSPFQHAVGAQRIWLQFVEVLVLADLFAYGSHRLFHAVPLLWRFHAIHHSCECLDWLASSRLHIVDIVVTRAVAFVPLYVMGFSPEALYPYLIFASIQGILIHANLRANFGPLRFLLVTPQFHHWHHTAQLEALDKNFAIHLPIVDWLFGTYYLPHNRWPDRYGIEGNRIPAPAPSPIQPGPTGALRTGAQASGPIVRCGWSTDLTTIRSGTGTRVRDSYLLSAG